MCIRALLALFALAACGDKDTDDTGADADGDGYPAGEDCDDGDAAVSPGADELCNGVDDNCDGEVDEAGATDGATWYADSDADGYGAEASTTQACAQPEGYSANADDCDDSDAAIRPGQEEQCDGVDEDCDGIVDDDVVDAPRWYADQDGDGYGDPSQIGRACDAPDGFVADNTDCNDTDAAAFPGSPEVCDSVDNDCNGAIDDNASDQTEWYPDRDGDGYGVSTGGNTACNPPPQHVPDGGDCDDGDPAVHPASVEVCDGVDNDCDGTSDLNAVDGVDWYTDSDGDGYGDANAVVVACDEPSGAASDATDCDDADASVHPGAEDVCYDGIDSDCLGNSDNDCDGDGEDELSTGGLDCDDTDASVNSLATEVDDAQDNDCDGLCDEGFIAAEDLQISEVMYNPSAVTDTNGEWFEVYNASGADLAICGGWSVEDTGGASHTIASELLIAADGYALFHRNADSGTNGGLTPDYVYSSVGLTNTSDDLQLVFDGSTIDSVAWDTSATPWDGLDSAGYSIQVDVATLVSSGNDDSSTWCNTTTVYGEGDHGTPGGANDSCF